MPIPALIGAALISAGASVGSNLLQNRANRRQWDRANRYNHPAAQMQRLKQAGLNPNLVYGDGNAIQSAPSPPQMRVENPTPAIVNAIIDMQRYKNLIKQEDKIAQETERIITDRALLQNKVSQAAIDTQVKTEMYGQNKDVYNQAELSRQKEQIEKTAQREIFNSNLDRTMKAKIMQIVSQSIQNQANSNLSSIKAEIEQEILRLRKADVNPNDKYVDKKIGQFLDYLLKKLNIQ